LADLPVQFGLDFLPVLVGPLSTIREDVGQLLQKLRFPAADLIGVDAEYAGQLGDGFLALDGLQGDLGLERCLILLPHTDHCAIPPCRDIAGPFSTLLHCPVFGVRLNEYIKRRVWTKLKGTNLMIECGGNVIARHTLREERYQDVPKDQL